MANPNIVNVTDIKGENSLTLLNSTSAISIVNNAAASNKVYKINSLVVANANTTTNYTVSVRIYSAASLGGSAFPIVSTLSIPANSSVIVVDKNSGVYLKENQSIGAQASTSNQLTVTASWEEIN
jgi:hypothetical protein